MTESHDAADIEDLFSRSDAIQISPAVHPDQSEGEAKNVLDELAARWPRHRQHALVTFRSTGFGPQQDQ